MGIWRGGDMFIKIEIGRLWKSVLGEELGFGIMGGGEIPCGVYGDDFAIGWGGGYKGGVALGGEFSDWIIADCGAEHFAI